MAEETIPPVPPSPESITPQDEAENFKKLGNEAFVNKKYDEAIRHYANAIKIDPECAVFYSNRSACYAAKQQWQQALEDAILCVSKDSKFVKGYFRLSTAQIELKLYDDAEATLKAVLTLEPDNQQAVKQLSLLKSKRKGGNVAKKPARQLDESQRKEFLELQEQLGTLTRDLRTVQSKLAFAQRESRANQVTAQHLASLPSELPTYRSVGRTFVLTPREEVDRRLEEELGGFTRSQRDLLDRKEYLERRISSTSNNIKDLTSNA